MKKKNVLNRTVNVCGKVVGERQASMNELYEKRTVRKAQEIAKDSSHVLAHNFELLPSGRRYRVPKVRLVRTRESFIPMSISLLNKK